MERAADAVRAASEAMLLRFDGGASLGKMLGWRLVECGRDSNLGVPATVSKIYIQSVVDLMESALQAQRRTAFSKF